MSFETAVRETPGLEDAYRSGLQALRGQDRQHIDPENPRALTGSVDVDSAYAASDPQAHRWDYGIAYQHSNRDAEVVYWVEIHPANDSAVDEVMKKLSWLQGWLRSTGALLNPFERDFVWVSSEKTTFTLNAPQRKKMAQTGLRHVGRVLRIPDARPG